MDWIRFLNRHKIEYVTSGPNVASGNIGIRCVFCGDDPSHHLGIHLKTGKWNCWRNSTHRGRKPHRLIAKLLNCSISEAKIIAGDGLTAQPEKLAELFSTSSDSYDQRYSQRTKKLEFPSNFYDIESTGSTSKFFNYLVKRGFNKRDIPTLIEDYDLKCCLDGRWKNRIIIPVYFEGQLVTWTSRSISNQQAPKYLHLSRKDDWPYALMSVKDTVFNFDEISEGGAVLIISEGPLDALKLDFYGKGYDVRATCLYGVSIKEEQAFLLEDIYDAYDKVIIMLDNGFLFQSLAIQNTLSFRTEFVETPYGAGDPGDLTSEQVIDFCGSL